MKKFNNINVGIEFKSIEQVEAEAIIVPQYPYRASRGGICQALERVGAAKVIERYNLLAEKYRLPDGAAVLLPTGEEMPRYIINIAVLDGPSTSFANGAVDRTQAWLSFISQAITDALRTADKRGIKEIAVPLIGVGALGRLDEKLSAQAIFKGIEAFAPEAQVVEKVTLALHKPTQGAQICYQLARW